MPKRFSKMLALLCTLVLVASLMPISYASAADDTENNEQKATPTASFGTPQLGSDDILWNQTMEHQINWSTGIAPNDTRPHATGTARILWDNDFVYARVAVKDSSLYIGDGGDHTYDSLEFYLGNGSSGSNQWRVSSTGIFSGQAAAGRAAWTKITEDGYLVEMRIPKRDTVLKEGSLTFEVYINNSTENGGVRYEVVSAFGKPDTAYNGADNIKDSLQLIGASQEDNRFSITTTAGPGGEIAPKPVGDVLRVAEGSDVKFSFTPQSGKVVEGVTVDGEAVTIVDNTYTLADIKKDHAIHVTFINDPNAKEIPFTVWNDNFASGEYTTAVIIDLGEGNAAEGSKLDPSMFTASAKDTTLDGKTIAFEGTRKISRVYVNDVPKVRGYKGVVTNSPDYQEGLASGRYIIVEFEFYSAVGGKTTLGGESNSTLQVYNLIQNKEIPLAEGKSLNDVVFEQDIVVNPLLDKFTTHTDNSVNYSLYLHKNEKGEVVNKLPLYVYTHGMSRGGTRSEIDQKAAMKSANGSVALMKKMEQNPETYASHVLNISYTQLGTPQAGNVKKVIDALIDSGQVDPNRVYAAGFSWGGQYTNNLVNSFPGFFAAAAPMAPVSGSPNAKDNPAHNKLAYWMFLNVHNTGSYQTNFDNYVNDNMPKMVNARASRFVSNEILTWPYNQFDQPDQRPNPAMDPVLPDWKAHEVEAAVLYNQITMGDWSIAPTAQSANLPAWSNEYTDVFDWMFAQRKTEGPDAPTNLKAAAGDKQATLSWTAPTNDGGSEILGYKVWYNNSAPVTLKATETKHTFTGLTNDQSYTFKVIAFSAKGDGTEIRAVATPKGSTPPSSGGSSSYTGNTGNTGTVTDTELSNSNYTVNTPKDKPAVKDSKGNITLSGGGEIATKGGTKVKLPEGTTIDSNGKVTIPADKTAEVTLPGSKNAVTIPSGSTVASDGTITLGGKDVVVKLPKDNKLVIPGASKIQNNGAVKIGSQGASLNLNGIALNIREGTELALDDATTLGFAVVSGNPFNDASVGDWFYNSVNLAYSHSLFDGTSSTKFSPNTSLTRAMFVQVLANLENINRSDYASSGFSDVSDGQWYTAAIEWAAQKGIVNGVSADRFDPNSPISREQMLVMLYNYMQFKGIEIGGSSSNSFADESAISSWALKAVQELQDSGIVSGKPNNLFAPKATATRAEVATVFARFIAHLAQ